MPIWSRQTNTRSGRTWRCSDTGWDYRGAQGEYQAGSHYAGFRLLTLVQGLQVGDIISHIKVLTCHDFLLTDDLSLTQLAKFLSLGSSTNTTYINLSHYVLLILIVTMGSSSTNPLALIAMGRMAKISPFGLRVSTNIWAVLQTGTRGGSCTEPASEWLGLTCRWACP
jgi:hypothetical protein